MLWRIVAALSEHLSTAFRSTIHEFSREIDGTEQQLDLGRLCLTQANKHFGMALGALFVQQHFSSQSKTKVRGGAIEPPKFGCKDPKCEGRVPVYTLDKSPQSL